MSRGDGRVAGGLRVGERVWAPPQFAHQSSVAQRLTMGTLGSNPSPGASEMDDFGMSLGCPIPQSRWEA